MKSNVVSISYDRELTKLRRELGDLVLSALNDKTVQDIMLNDDGNIWIERAGKDMECCGSMSPEQAINLICTVASMLGLEATAAKPIIEGELPLDGSRFEALIPPIVKRPIFDIRTQAIKVFTMDEYVRSGIMTEKQKEIIENHIMDRHNVLVVGGTGTGKTTLCNAILHQIAELDPTTRILILQDTLELQCSAKNVCYLRTNRQHHITMNDLVQTTLRLRPDRLVIGEVRDGAALELIKAWNTGHGGGVATVHANSAQEGLLRIEQLVQEVITTAQKPVIAAAINCIVCIKKNRDHKRVISEIVSMKGATNDAYNYDVY